MYYLSLIFRLAALRHLPQPIICETKPLVTCHQRFPRASSSSPIFNFDLLLASVILAFALIGTYDNTVSWYFDNQLKSILPSELLSVEHACELGLKLS